MFQNKWKLTAISLALIIVLLASCFVILYKPEAAQAKEPMLLDVSIEGKAKLNVDELSNYKVNVVGGVGELSYDWSFTPADGKARFYDNGATASIVFKNATEEPYLLEVKVYDAAGNFGVASMAVYDPPTFPSTYLGVYGAPYSYMIKADGTGWYYAVDGNTGAVAWSSTNASYVVNSAFNNPPSLGKNIVILIGSFSVTSSFLVPSNTIFDYSSATLTLADSANCNVIQNLNAAIATPPIDSNITLICGTINGNAAGQSTVINSPVGHFGPSGITFRAVANVQVINPTITNTYDHGLEISGYGATHTVSVIDANISNTGFYPIAFYNLIDLSVSDLHVSLPTTTNAALFHIDNVTNLHGSNFELTGGMEGLDLVGMIKSSLNQINIKNTNGVGINFSTLSCYAYTVTDFNIDGCTYGIRWGEGTAVYNDGKISDFTIYNATNLVGIINGACNGLIIDDGTVKTSYGGFHQQFSVNLNDLYITHNTITGTTGAEGLVIIQGNRIHISGNNIYGNYYQNFYMASGVNNTIVTDNILLPAGSGSGSSVDATNKIVENNQGLANSP